MRSGSSLTRPYIKLREREGEAPEVEDLAQCAPPASGVGERRRYRRAVLVTVDRREALQHP